MHRAQIIAARVGFFFPVPFLDRVQELAVDGLGLESRVWPGLHPDFQSSKTICRTLQFENPKPSRLNVTNKQTGVSVGTLEAVVPLGVKGLKVFGF